MSHVPYMNRRICYDMCTQRAPQNWAGELYQRHNETVARYLTENVLPALRAKASQGDAALLAEFTRRWSNHKIMNEWLRRFFTYLDQYHIKHHGLPKLLEVGFILFRVAIYEQMKTAIASAIQSLIDKERDQFIVDRSLIKSVVVLYETMGMGTLEAYTRDLEGPLLTSTQQYYSRMAVAWANDPMPEYLSKAYAALKDEQDRVVNYLNARSKNKIVRVVETEILCPLLEREDTGCFALLRNDKSEDLRLMYKIFEPLEIGLLPMAQVFQQYLVKGGTDIVNRRQARLNSGERDTNEDADFIQAMIAFHKKYAEVVKKYLTNHYLFQKALSDAFVIVMNKNVGQFTNAELLSSYCDRSLRKKVDDQEFDDIVDDLVQLSSFVADKDFLAEAYRTQLAQRLLSQSPSSDERERLMISKMKIQHGIQFTSKMEGMLADLVIGREHRVQFEQSGQKADLKIDFGVLVLTSGFWPSAKGAEVQYSDEMMKCMKRFELWHGQQHQNRRLQWLTKQGYATVTATFGEKTYDLQVSTLQAIVLDALNGGETFSLSGLALRLNLDAAMLKPVLHSLTCCKHKVIAKIPAGKKIDFMDRFVANSNFTSKERKFRIPMPSLFANLSKAKVEENRVHAIEAAIVRIMKARTTLSHQKLLSEVMAQLTFFRPEPRDVKKRIEAMIDREYLERNPDNPTFYNYLA
jgi:cullin 1